MSSHPAGAASITQLSERSNRTASDVGCIKWTAVTWHKKDDDWNADKWELYHTDVDFSENNDLAAQMPERLCHVAVPRARSVGTSGIVRQLRLQSATWSSRHREARGAFGRR